MRMLSASLAVCFVLALCGCGEAVVEAAKASLAAKMFSSKERAVAFDVVKAEISPVAGEDAALIARFVKAHGEDLASEAAALSNFNDAVKASGKLDDESRKTIGHMAFTAEKRGELFAQFRPKLAGTEKVSKFLDVHKDALVEEAKALRKLATLLPPKPEKAEAAVARE